MKITKRNRKIDFLNSSMESVRESLKIKGDENVKVIDLCEHDKTVRFVKVSVPISSDLGGSVERVFREAGIGDYYLREDVGVSFRNTQGDGYSFVFEIEEEIDKILKRKEVEKKEYERKKEMTERFLKNLDEGGLKYAHENKYKK